ncbi:MAG: hypothetical protein EAX96_20575 [Candidatus Lokiarchaeota archaeon]|nr:hypothetical protein [Candidatus Lokiarchaeota archaeon]
MEIKIAELVKDVKHLIPIYSKEFKISEEGSAEFLRLAIIETIKTNKKIKMENIDKGFIIGEETEIQALRNEISSWDENEFDLEDFEVIGYCKNIR